MKRLLDKLRHAYHQRVSINVLCDHATHVWQTPSVETSEQTLFTIYLTSDLELICLGWIGLPLCLNRFERLLEWEAN